MYDFCMKVPKDETIDKQVDFVKRVFEGDEMIMDILKDHRVVESGGYLGAGCVNQRIWNAITGRDSTYGIGDYDFVYFDGEDLSEEKEREFGEYLKDRFASIDIDCVNEARVHLWYEGEFGKKIDPYVSTEDAINSWITTATCIGVRYGNDDLEIYAPHGLNDIMSLTLRPAKDIVTKERYEEKAKKWLSKWPELNVIEWGDA